MDAIRLLKATVFVVFLALLGAAPCWGGEYCYNDRDYKYCSNGCCGNYGDHYCCASSGAIVGIVFGCIFFIAVVCAITCWCMHMKNRSRMVVTQTPAVAYVSTTTTYPPGYANYGNPPPPGYMQGPPTYTATAPPPPAYAHTDPGAKPVPANPFATAAEAAAQPGQPPAATQAGQNSQATK